MNILQISTADRGGGAEGSALNLHKSFLKGGHDAWLAVGTRYTGGANILEIPRKVSEDAGFIRRHLFGLSQQIRRMEHRIHGTRKLARILERLSSPERMKEWRAGQEEFNFPGCRALAELPPHRPDVIHCHNLHGYYFDLRLLPELSAHFPLILNLRDAWLLSGHCAYFMDCMKWKDGCVNCPKPAVYPPIRDAAAAAENWLRKKRIYADSTIFATAPSRWLLDQAKDSILKAYDYRVIPNGIDISVFKPGSRSDARRRIGLPDNVKILMFAAASRNNIFKDMETLEKAVSELAERNPELHFLCVGMRIPALEKLPNMHRLPYVASPEAMADCYRASDVFLHSAKAEAFGKTIVEAMACGAPVVSPAVGGIPELLENGREGFLTEPAAPGEMAQKVLDLLACPDYAAMSGAAAARGSEYSLEKQTANFLAYYRDVAEMWKNAITEIR